MTIHWREDLKRRWAVMVYTDPYTVADWQKTMSEILAHPIASRPLRVLVDRRHCRAPAAQFIQQISDFMRRHHDRFRGGSVAIVASDAAGYGVARMTELLLEAEKMPCAVRAFRDWAEAEVWLEEELGKHVGG